MPLTEVQKNLLVGFGVSVVAGLTVATAIAIAEALRPGEAPAKHSLSVEATPGGTTDPPPGFYKYDEATSVTVTAIVFEGYEFKGWHLNGENVGSQETLTLTVYEQNILIASFEEIGAPPLLPSYIKPIQNCVAEDWWHTWVEGRTLRLGQDFMVHGFVKFKICDAAGNGVPDQQLAVYGDVQPDITDYGFMYINGRCPELSTPEILTSDSAGVVAAKIGYKWYEPNSDFRGTIGYGGQAVYHTPLGIPSETTVYPIWDGYTVGWPRYWTRFERKRHPIYRTLNPVHVYWVDNPNLMVYGDCIADCVVKIEPSKNY